MGNNDETFSHEWTNTDINNASVNASTNIHITESKNLVEELQRVITLQASQKAEMETFLTKFNDIATWVAKIFKL